MFCLAGQRSSQADDLLFTSRGTQMQGRGWRPPRLFLPCPTETFAGNRVLMKTLSPAYHSVAFAWQDYLINGGANV